MTHKLKSHIRSDVFIYFIQFFFYSIEIITHLYYKITSIFDTIKVHFVYLFDQRQTTNACLLNRFFLKKRINNFGDRIGLLF